MKKNFLAPSLVTAALLMGAGHADAVVNRTKRTETELQRQHERIQNDLHTMSRVTFTVILHDPAKKTVDRKVFEIPPEAGGTVHFGDAGLVIHSGAFVAGHIYDTFGYNYAVSDTATRQRDHKILVSADGKFGEDASEPQAVRDLLINLVDSHEKKLDSGIIVMKDEGAFKRDLQTMKELVVHLDGMLKQGGAKR